MADSCQRLRERGGWAEDAALGRCQFPIGPRNTWSNAFYAFVGITIAAVFQTGEAAAFAVAMMLLATGSALYHGYKTKNANVLDWVGMYAVFGTLVGHGWLTGSFFAVGFASWGMLALGAGFVAWYGYRRWMSSDLSLGIMFLASWIPAFLWGGRLLSIVALNIFIVALALWRLDKKKSPLVGLWGHAWWHKLTALGFGVLFVAQIR